MKDVPAPAAPPSSSLMLSVACWILCDPGWFETWFAAPRAPKGAARWKAEAKIGDGDDDDEGEGCWTFGRVASERRSRAGDGWAEARRVDRREGARRESMAEEGQAKRASRR